MAFYEPQEIPFDHNALEAFLQIGEVRLQDDMTLALFDTRVSTKNSVSTITSANSMGED